MKPKMRRHLPGSFMTRELRNGLWQLTRSAPPSIELFVRGAETRTEALPPHDVRDVDIEWRAEAVLLSLKTAGGPASVQARSVIVHEPLPRLYDALPLAGLDADARHFWRNVFRLVRIPGGRFLLRLLASRARRRG